MAQNRGSNSNGPKKENGSGDELRWHRKNERRKVIVMAQEERPVAWDSFDHALSFVINGAGSYNRQ